MENYDKSKLTREELFFFLNAAKEEMIKYSRCYEKVESCETNIEKAKQDSKQIYFRIGFFCFLLLFVGLFFGILKPLGMLTDSGISIAFLVSVLLSIVSVRWIANTNKMKPQKKIEEYEAQLPNLKKEENDAFDKFYTIIEPYKFPRDYWYEYALSKMLEFVEKGQADNWKEVVNKYEDHSHQMRMEENAQQTLDVARKTLDVTRKTLEETRKQTGIAIQTRSAARWAAAGVWLR